MRGKSHNARVQSQGRRSAGIVASLIVVQVLAGCSAANLTGFDYPAFSIVKKSGAGSEEAVGSAGVPAAPQKLNTL